MSSKSKILWGGINVQALRWRQNLEEATGYLGYNRQSLLRAWAGTWLVWGELSHPAEVLGTSHDSRAPSSARTHMSDTAASQPPRRNNNTSWTVEDSVTRNPPHNHDSVT